MDWWRWIWPWVFFSVVSAGSKGIQNKREPLCSTVFFFDPADTVSPISHSFLWWFVFSLLSIFIFLGLPLFFSDEIFENHKITEAWWLTVCPLWECPTHFERAVSSWLLWFVGKSANITILPTSDVSSWCCSGYVCVLCVCFYWHWQSDGFTALFHKCQLI